MSFAPKTCFAFLVVTFLCHSLSAQTQYNFDFENIDKTKGRPTGWGGNIIHIDSVIKQSGQISLSLEKAPAEKAHSYSYYFIKPVFGGKKITLTGYLKCENVEDGVAGLWIRVDGEGQNLKIDNMQGRELKGTQDWKQYTLEVPYDEHDATDIYIGTYISGKGKIWMDNLQLL